MTITVIIPPTVRRRRLGERVLELDTSFIRFAHPLQVKRPKDQGSACGKNYNRSRKPELYASQSPPPQIRAKSKPKTTVSLHRSNQTGDLIKTIPHPPSKATH